MLALCFTIVPLSPGILLEYIIGAAMLVLGMMFFTLGAEMAMTPMGERVGSSMTRSKKLWVMVILGLVLGLSSPCRSRICRCWPSRCRRSRTWSLSWRGRQAWALPCGGPAAHAVGIPLPRMLVVFYLIVFALAAFTPKAFLAVAFDSGGVTTGPMTVPFIMALGIGIAAIRSDRHAADDSFGLVALCSIGPILAVLILGLIYETDGGAYSQSALTEVGDSIELGRLFLHALPEYLGEIAVSLLPIALFFALFQIFSLRLKKRPLIKILVGLFYTYIGLVLFLDGRECRVHAGGELPRPDDRCPSLPVDHRPHRHADRLLYRHGGACRVRADPAGWRN